MISSDRAEVKQDVTSSVIAQAKVRVKVGIPVILLMLLSVWYWGSPHGPEGHIGVAIVAMVHILYIAVVFFLSTIKKPELSERIVIATAIFDPLVLSGWLAMMGESGGLFICFYLFTMLGFGFRIGPRPMWICQGAAIIGFCFVMAVAPVWRQHPIIGLSFLMLLVVVPMYATILMKKLRDARALAENESQAKSQLLANVSHELRTPLNGIVVSAQLIASETHEEGIGKRADTILRLSNDLVLEINDLLDSAKYHANSLTLDSALFDLTDVLEQVRVTLSPTATSKGIDFTVSMDVGIQSRVVGDAHYLGRALMNIAGNAVKFTEKGQVDVRLKLLKNEIDNYRIRFSVKDTGIGISKEFYEKIFEPFTQASAGTTRKFGGTGLGMSIAKDIVSLMGGEIVLESELGKGSLFYFDLILPKGVKPAEEKPEMSDAPIICGKRIFVADDNGTNLLLIKELLQRDRHVVMTANTGQEAIEILAVANFDLVILDFNMGDMDGATVLQIYRFGKVNPAPAIFLTADTTERTAATLKNSGAVGVLHKPISGDALRDAIAKVFGSEIIATIRPKPFQPVSASLKPVPQLYIDHTAIENLKEICSRPDFMAEVLSSAVEDIGKNCNNLLDALEIEDIEAIRESAHALKGVSMSVGAVRLVSLTNKLMTITHGELRSIKAQLKKDVKDVCDRSIGGLRDILVDQSVAR
jgi:two-component system sensor histidine kinase RpfC